MLDFVVVVVVLVVGLDRLLVLGPDAAAAAAVCVLLGSARWIS